MLQENTSTGILTAVTDIMSFTAHHYSPWNEQNRKYLKINTSDLVFWNYKNIARFTLLKYKTTFILTHSLPAI